MSSHKTVGITEGQAVGDGVQPWMECWASREEQSRRECLPEDYAARLANRNHARFKRVAGYVERLRGEPDQGERIEKAKGVIAAIVARSIDRDENGPSMRDLLKVERGKKRWLERVNKAADERYWEGRRNGRRGPEI